MKEHQENDRKQRERSHVWKHRALHHQVGAAPFIVKAVSFHKTALSRQAAEAVRIKRRGGEGLIVNSQSSTDVSFLD